MSSNLQEIAAAALQEQKSVESLAAEAAAAAADAIAAAGGVGGADHDDDDLEAEAEAAAQAELEAEGPVDDDGTGTPADSKKRKRDPKYHRLSISRKLEILAALDSGERGSVVAKQFQVSDATVSIIKRQRESLIDLASRVKRPDLITGKRQRIGRFPFLEACLFQWCTAAKNLNINLTYPMLREKAIAFRNYLTTTPNVPGLSKEEAEVTKSFEGSRNWLAKFCTRFNIDTTALNRPDGGAAAASPAPATPSSAASPSSSSSSSSSASSSSPSSAVHQMSDAALHAELTQIAAAALNSVQQRPSDKTPKTKSSSSSSSSSSAARSEAGGDTDDEAFGDDIDMPDFEAASRENPTTSSSSSSSSSSTSSTLSSAAASAAVAAAAALASGSSSSSSSSLSQLLSLSSAAVASAAANAATTPSSLANTISQLLNAPKTPASSTTLSSLLTPGTADSLSALTALSTSTAATAAAAAAGGGSTATSSALAGLAVPCPSAIASITDALTAMRAIKTFAERQTWGTPTVMGRLGAAVETLRRQATQLGAPIASSVGSLLSPAPTQQTPSSQ